MKSLTRKSRSVLSIPQYHTRWSGSTSIEENPIPVAGGIVLNTYDFDDVTVRRNDLQAVVGPGAVYDDLNATLAPYNLRFAPGIAAGDIATIGE